MFFSLLTFLIFAADRALKIYINSSMRVNESIPVIHNVLHITYVRNKGAAFGLFWGDTWFLILVGVLAIAGIIFFHEKIRSNDFLQIPLAFVLGGSLGNMFDRVFNAYVIDYIDFRVWPVFNLADIMINVGVCIMLYKIIKDKGN